MKKIKYVEQFKAERQENIILSVNYDELRQLQFELEVHTTELERDLEKYDWMRGELNEKALIFLKGLCADIDHIISSELEYRCRVINC